ncbi:MAG: ribose-phosphate diphosphokinase, partial [Bryobacterales bacterium]|nr:ribose-phosphate diphosphokinase [Bryobacterales bacterium]
MSFDRLKIFTGNANAALTQEICQCLGVQTGDAT